MRYGRGFLVMVIVATILAPASAAFAYIDAGTGSYIFQLLIGGMLAGGVLVRLYWNRLKAFFSRSKSEPFDEEQ